MAAVFRLPLRAALTLQVGAEWLNYLEVSCIASAALSSAVMPAAWLARPRKWLHFPA